jgi:hypothetical protein
VSSEDAAQKDHDRLAAERLDYERRWAEEHGGEEIRRLTAGAYERHVERVGYDPLAESSHDGEAQ